MNVYEQQARALKEIAAELKGIRRALESLEKGLQREAFELAGASVFVDREAEPKKPALCSFFGGECDQKHPDFCSDPCDYRVEGGAGNG